MRLLALAVFASALQAAVDGVVINQTSGKPQGGATVTLYRLGETGMESLESVKSAPDGKFAISRNAQGPHLIQTAWDGVLYNHMLPPGAPRNGITLDVYDATSSRPAGVKLRTHMILLEPGAEDLNVSESYVFENSGKTTFNNPDQGVLRFFVPPGAAKLRVMATAPQGVPVERAAEKARQPNVYWVDFPVKPGETRFDLTYTLPQPSPGVFETTVLQRETPTRIVVPAGVTLNGEGLELLGREPTTQASVYEYQGKQVRVEFDGFGTLGGPHADSEPDEAEGLRQIRPAVYDRLPWILGLAGLILLAGLLLLYLKDAPAAAVPAAAPDRSKKGKRRE